MVSYSSDSHRLLPSFLPSFLPPAVLDFAEMPVLLVMGQKGSRLHRPIFVTMMTSDDAVLSSSFESRTPGANCHLLSKLFPFDHCHPAQSLSPQFCDTPEPLVFQTTHCPRGLFWVFFWREGVCYFILFFVSQTIPLKAFHLA